MYSAHRTGPDVHQLYYIARRRKTGPSNIASFGIADPAPGCKRPVRGISIAGCAPSQSANHSRPTIDDLRELREQATTRRRPARRTAVDEESPDLFSGILSNSQSDLGGGADAVAGIAQTANCEDRAHRVTSGEGTLTHGHASQIEPETQPIVLGKERRFAEPRDSETVLTCSKAAAEDRGSAAGGSCSPHSGPQVPDHDLRIASAICSIALEHAGYSVPDSFLNQETVPIIVEIGGEEVMAFVLQLLGKEPEIRAPERIPIASTKHSTLSGLLLFAGSPKLDVLRVPALCTDVAMENASTPLHHLRNDWNTYRALVRLADRDGERISEHISCVQVGYDKLIPASSCSSRALERAFPRLAALGYVYRYPVAHHGNVDTTYWVRSPEGVKAMYRDAGCTHVRRLRGNAVLLIEAVCPCRKNDGDLQ